MRAHPVILFGAGVVVGYLVGRWHMASSLKGKLG